MNVQNAFSLVAVFYSVANLGSMGIELNLRETLKSLRSLRVLALTLGWCWVVGPAMAILLTKILPMAEPYAVGLLIFGLAPTAPMLPILIRKARADISLAAAIMPLAVVSTVILMPLLAPLLIPGLTLSSWDNGSAMLMAVTAFPVIDPKLMAMALLAVPVPVVVWLVLAKFFAFRADKTGVKAATELFVE